MYSKVELDSFVLQHSGTPSPKSEKVTYFLLPFFEKDNWISKFDFLFPKIGHKLFCLAKRSGVQDCWYNFFGKCIQGKNFI